MMRRVSTGCDQASGSTEPTGTSSSLVRGRGTGERVVSDPCTDTSSSALTGRLGGTKSGPRHHAAPGVCGQNVLPLLGSRVPRGSQPVTSFFPNIVRSICLCRDMKERTEW